MGCRVSVSAPLLGGDVKEDHVAASLLQREETEAQSSL